MWLLQIWDVSREQRVQDVPMGVGAAELFVSALTSAYRGQNLLAAGFTDGSVRVYDRRMAANESRVMSLHDLCGARVQGIYLAQSPSGSQSLVAAAADGQVAVWEPRMYHEPTAKRRLLIQVRHLGNPIP